MEEIEKIKKAYARRAHLGKDKLHSKFNPAALYNGHQIQKEIINAFKKNGINDISNKRILDVGCGVGNDLRNFVQFGANPDNLNGIDLLPESVERAKKISSNINFKCANAEDLPFDSNYFDIVVTFVTFTSILDSQMKKNIAKEMERVLAPQGIILWYDFFLNNPWNPDVRGVKKREIYKLFPGCKIWFKKISLIPQIIRFLAPYSWLACYLLEKIPLLRTHYLAVIHKRKMDKS